MHKRIVCVGSRRIGEEHKLLCKKIGEYLARRGDYIITGNAPGADSEFRAGAEIGSPGQVELHLPWKGFGKKPHKENHVIVQDKVGIPEEHKGTKKSTPAFYARNRAMITHDGGAHQVIALPKRSGDRIIGGTANTIAHAQNKGVEVIDLGTREGIDRIVKVFEDKKRHPKGFEISEEELDRIRRLKEDS